RHRLAAQLAFVLGEDRLRLDELAVGVELERTRALALGVTAAPEEPAALAPTLEHRLAADLTLLVRRRRLGVPALALLRRLELLLEALVEVLEQALARELSRLDEIEILLHLRG